MFRWSMLGLQGALLSNMFDPVHLSSVIVSVHDFPFVAAHNACRTGTLGHGTPDHPRATPSEMLVPAVLESLQRTFQSRLVPPLREAQLESVVPNLRVFVAPQPFRLGHASFVPLSCPCACCLTVLLFTRHVALQGWDFSVRSCMTQKFTLGLCSGS